MCQAYEAENRYLVQQEWDEIKEAYAKHLSGEKILTEEELRSLAVKRIMLME